jgi:guanine deaminase
MRRAIELSVKNLDDAAGGPFGAVVVKDGKIIGEGTNRVTSTNDPSAHAEVVAIREACRRLECFQLTGCELYTTCEPCPMCMALVYWAHLDKVYYANTADDAAKIGFDDARIYRELKLPHEQRSLPLIQMMRQEAMAAFTAWERKPDKVRY